MARSLAGTCALAGLLIMLLGCGAATTPAIAPPPAVGDPGAAQTYVAIGASETVGAGINDDPLRLRDAWPQLFFNDALTRASTFVDLGIPGATVARALTDELPAALRLRPAVVTVWLNVDDLVQGVRPDQYEVQLGQLVHALRQAGRARVLIATTPVLEHLPAYLSCLRGGPCLFPGTAPVPGADAVVQAVSAYNAAITRVAQREGAIVVDLHAQGDIALSHPDWIGSDGFHPSFLGHAAVAQLFTRVYRSSTGAL